MSAERAGGGELAQLVADHVLLNIDRHVLAPVGRPGPVTPWGKPAMGYKTRKGKNPTSKFIVKRRNEK